jgi:transposase InsO family protein
MNSLLDLPDKMRDEVQEATATDPAMQTLSNLIRNGWPEKKNEVPNEVRPYFDIRDTLGYQNGIILKGERIVIPLSLRREMKQRLHAAHLGYDSMMRRARDLVFWPSMTQDIKQTADNCETCQRMKPQNQKETLKQHDDGKKAWMKIGVDLCEVDGRQHLVTVDYFSNFIEVDYLPNTSASEVTSKLKGQFARYGVPTEVVSDQGPQFTSSVFKKMTKRFGVIHTTSSPTHHQANGKAESAVKIVKYMLLKCIREESDPYEALLELRNTPAQDTGLSPTQMMFGHLTRGRLPAATDRPLTAKRMSQAKNRRIQRRQAVKNCYDKKARDLPPLHSGQPVYFQHKEGHQWQRGTVQKKRDDRSYIIKGENEGLYRRNRIHARPTCPPQHLYPSTPEPVNEPPSEAELLESSDVDSSPVLPCPLPSPRPQRVRQKPGWLDDYETT